VTELTPDEIRGRIEAELKKRAISEDPAVLVAVREYVSHTILVTGLVKDPGTKILRREAIPLYVVLADAQPHLEAGRAIIVAKETGEVTTVELSDERALSVVVRPGDVINVQASPKQFFYIGGEVKAPGEKTFRPGLTLTQAILAAGGLSRKSKEVQLARESTNRRLVVTRHKLEDINSGKLPDPLIQQGDRITVVH
jgi:polysaccharide export outer membrane protein